MPGRRPSHRVAGCACQWRRDAPLRCAGTLNVMAEPPPHESWLERPVTFSDEELTALALKADADRPLPDVAVPWSSASTVAGAVPVAALPGWYLPASAAGHGSMRGWRRVVGWVIVAALVAVVTSGLCSTYGVLELA